MYHVYCSWYSISFTKKGKPKKQFKIAGILFIVFIIGMAASPVPEESSIAEEEVAVSNEVENETEEKAEIAPSTVVDVTSNITVDMTFDAYNEAKENKLNVEIPETLSTENRTVGEILKATDGFVVVETNALEVLSVETFPTIDEAKVYGEKLVEEAKATETAVKERLFENSKIVLSGSGDTSTDLITDFPNGKVLIFRLAMNVRSDKKGQFLFGAFI